MVQRKIMLFWLVIRFDDNNVWIGRVNVCRDPQVQRTFTIH